MQNIELFKSITSTGNSELDIVLELLENAWKDEVQRLTQLSAKPSDIALANKRYTEAQSIRNQIVGANSIPKTTYKLAELIKAVKSGKPPHLSRAKLIDVAFTHGDKDVKFSATSWSRLHGELYRNILSTAPKSFDFLWTHHAKPLGLHNSGDHLNRAFEIAPGYFLETNLSTAATLKKIHALATHLNIGKIITFAA